MYSQSIILEVRYRKLGSHSDSTNLIIYWWPKFKIPQEKCQSYQKAFGDRPVNFYPHQWMASLTFPQSCFSKFRTVVRILREHGAHHHKCFFAKSLKIKCNITFCFLFLKIFKCLMNCWVEILNFRKFRKFITKHFVCNNSEIWWTTMWRSD